MLARARCAPSAGPLSTGTAVGGYVSAVSRRPRPLRAVNPRGKGATAHNATSPGCTRAGGGAEGGAPRNSRKSQPRLPSALAEGVIAIVKASVLGVDLAGSRVSWLRPVVLMASAVGGTRGVRVCLRACLTEAKWAEAYGPQYAAWLQRRGSDTGASGKLRRR